MTQSKILTGTARAYLLKRLQQDYQEAYERVITGELSARAAAIEVGLHNPPLQLTRNVELAAKRLKEYYDTDELLELVRQLTESLQALEKVKKENVSILQRILANLKAQIAFIQETT